MMCLSVPTRIVHLAVAVILTLCLSPVARAQDDVLVFSYFKNPDGLDGLHLAYSLDGFSWHAMNGDQGFLTPLSGSLMRDPAISRGPDGTFHMVHTVTWGSTTNIGYAKSTDLLNWTDQKYIPVMTGFNNVLNVWAPELFYDAPSDKYRILWASRVDGVGHRIYATSTSDFNTFDPTWKFYDPGFDVIDATIVKDGANHVMFVKDERQSGGYLYVFKAQGGTNVDGPYDTTTIPRISGNYAFEGPTAIKIGDTWFLYGDRYGEGRMGLLTSNDDMQTWQERVADIAFPGGTKHGTVFRASRSIVDNLIASATNATSQINFDNQAGTGNLLTAGNWMGRLLPSTGQTPVIQNGQSATLSQTLSGTFNEFWIGMTSPGTLTMSGGTLTMSGWLCVGRNNGSEGSIFNHTGGRINTGSASTGSVGPTAEGSYTLSNDARLAITNTMYHGETGRATITQLDSSHVTAGNITLGRWSTGAATYNLQSGTLGITSNFLIAERGSGVVNQSGGTATVGGFMSVGLRGSGTMNMDGGTLIVSADFNVADIRASRGVLNVNGGTMTLGALYVGSGYNESGSSGSSIGTVTQNGGLIQISRNADRIAIGGRDTVNAAGHYFMNGGTLQTGQSNMFVGSRAPGTFNQSGGQVVADQWVSIGRYATGTGTAIFAGGTFQQTNAATRVIVGELGAGTLVATGSGSVDLVGGLRIAATGGSGTVILQGGILSTPFVEDGGGTSSLRFNGGTLRARRSTGTFLQGLDSAWVQLNGGMIDTQNNTITIAQPLLHDPTLIVRDGGLTKIGSGTATLTGNNTYTGHTTLAEGVLRFRPQGAADFPIQNAVEGDIILNGGIALLDYSQGASNPQTLVTFELTDSSDDGFQTGRIRTTLLADTSKAIGWLNDGTTLSLRYTHKGDIDLNGIVDSVDFSTLVGGYGMSGALWKDGDNDYDGKVTTTDFNHLAGNFGAPLVLGASLSGVVPEPAAVSMIALSCMLIARRGRSKGVAA